MFVFVLEMDSVVNVGKFIYELSVLRIFCFSLQEFVKCS